MITDLLFIDPNDVAQNLRLTVLAHGGSLHLSLDARNNQFNQTRVPPLRSLLCEGFSTSCSAESIRAFVATNVASGATLKTDGLAAYLVLPWTCRVFANLKRWALGVDHGLRRNQFQSYLDAFVFRFNRRRSRCAALRSMLGTGA